MHVCSVGHIRTESPTRWKPDNPPECWDQTNFTAVWVETEIKRLAVVTSAPGNMSPLKWLQCIVVYLLLLSVWTLLCFFFTLVEDDGSVSDHWTSDPPVTWTLVLSWLCAVRQVAAARWAQQQLLPPLRRSCDDLLSPLNEMYLCPEGFDQFQLESKKLQPPSLLFSPSLIQIQICFIGMTVIMHSTSKSSLCGAHTVAALKGKVRSS